MIPSQERKLLQSIYENKTSKQMELKEKDLKQDIKVLIEKLPYDRWVKDILMVNLKYYCALV